MKLSKEQNRALQLALRPEINSLFVTGQGGTGKSEIIKILCEQLNPKDYILLAPTQSAALKIGGKTIHSFFKVKPTINLNVEKEADVISFCLDEIDTESADGKIVIIDEASMLGESMLTGILSRIKPKKLILFGDPTQLKPIKDNTVDWSDFCDETIYLTHNFRVQNEELRGIIETFRDEGHVIMDADTVSDISDLNYCPKTIYMAHTNETLSAMQKHFLGYSNAKINDTLLTFGACDDTIQKIIKVAGKQIVTSYFGNNDLVVVKSVPRLIDKGLWSCDVVIEKDYIDGTDSIQVNQYNKTPRVIVGDYNVYKRILQRRFKAAQNKQKELFKKYKVDKSAILKKRMTMAESEDLRLKWIEYFNLKNSPYARHHQFRTTYKAQGQSFDSVVIDWYDLPSKDHKYVAMSRAQNNLTLIMD